jgi:hypothetical protein
MYLEDQLSYLEMADIYETADRYNIKVAVFTPMIF